MALIIDSIYVCRELLRLIFVVVTSPFAIVDSLLMLGSTSWQ
ncbi:MAG: hypothetical protein RQ732_10920 [Methylophaga sp.]|nr:hypothetical protein [Methylophaga sp.]